MQIIDVIILLILLLGLYSGYRQGFVSQIASLIGLVIGYFVAKQYYLLLAKEVFSSWVDNKSVTELFSFFIIWLVVVVVIGLVGRLFSKLFDKISLGWLNRLIGALVGCLKYLFLLSLVIGIYDVLDQDNKLLSQTNKRQSLLYKPTKELVKDIYGLIKDNKENIIKKAKNIDI